MFYVFFSKLVFITALKSKPPSGWYSDIGPKFIVKAIKIEKCQYRARFYFFYSKHRKKVNSLDLLLFASLKVSTQYITIYCSTIYPIPNFNLFNSLKY